MLRTECSEDPLLQALPYQWTGLRKIYDPSGHWPFPIKVKLVKQQFWNLLPPAMQKVGLYPVLMRQNVPCKWIMTLQKSRVIRLDYVVKTEPWHLPSHWGFLYCILARHLGYPHRKCSFGELQMLTACELRALKLSATNCQLMWDGVAESQSTSART